MELKNRLVIPPMATSRSSEGGTVTPQLCDYYAEKSARGYIGLILTEHSYISIEGKAKSGQLSISRASNIKGLSQIVNIIHGNGSRVMAQISHADGAAKSEVTGRTALVPSVVAVSKGRAVPAEMNAEDIQKVIWDFSSAAVRAKKADFDGVEIHSAHAYLLNQFYSPLTNRRTDKYGGTAVGDRLMLHLEVIEAIHIPVVLTGGITTAESAKALLENGKADLIGVGRAILKDSLWAKNAVLI